MTEAYYKLLDAYYADPIMNFEVLDRLKQIELMSKEQNKLLPYLSSIYDSMEGELAQIDETLTSFDDGEKRGIPESRKQACATLQNAISNLVTLRRDIRTLPYKDFCAKYGLNE